MKDKIPGALLNIDIPLHEGGNAYCLCARMAGAQDFVLSIVPSMHGHSPETDGKCCIIMQAYADFVYDKMTDEHGDRFVVLMHSLNRWHIADQYKQLEFQNLAMILEEWDMRDAIPFKSKQVWDNETQAYWDIVQWNGRYWGFPDSSRDGTPLEHMAFLRTSEEEQ